MWVCPELVREPSAAVLEVRRRATSVVCIRAVARLLKLACFPRSADLFRNPNHVAYGV